MSFSVENSWNVSKYRNEHDMDHEWNLKKKFILAHKDKYDEDRLISLAQMFCNIYYLGCRYPEPVMELLDSLSKDISDKNQKWERQSFLPASTAVEERVKGRLNLSESQPGPSLPKMPMRFVQGTNLKSNDPVKDNQRQSAMELEEGGRRKEVWIRGQKRSFSPNCGNTDSVESRKKGCTDMNVKRTSYSVERRRVQFDVKRVVESGPFGKVVVFQSAISKEESPISVIERTASAAHMMTSYEYSAQPDETTCKLSLDAMYLSTGKGRTQKVAKESACKVAIERLKETSFTILVKASFVGSESIERDLTGDKKNKQRNNMDTPIADSNIGNKMLKLMGWTGGGLGKNEQGIEEPLRPYDYNVRRGGLGIANFADFRRKIIRIIEDFAHSDTKEDLVFSPEFSKEERKVIHELVRKYNLKSRSFGKEEDNRRLVVFKKIRPLEIVEDLILCGGETDKYKLLAPNSSNFVSF